MIFVRKINKISEFYMISARKIFSRFFFLGGGGRAPFSPPSPTPMRKRVTKSYSSSGNYFYRELLSRGSLFQCCVHVHVVIIMNNLAAFCSKVESGVTNLFHYTDIVLYVVFL